MYLQKKSSKRKAFVPLSVKRKKKRRIKVLFLFFSFCLFLFLCFWCISKGVDYLFEHRSQWFAWKAKTYQIQADDKYTEKEIKELLSFKEDTLFSSADAKNLQSTLTTKIPQIQKAEVKRGFFSKKLTIKTNNYNVLAILKDTQTEGEKNSLLSDSGVIFNYEQAKIPQGTITVNFKQKIKSAFLPQELVKLIKDISANPLKELESVDVDLQAGVFALNFKEGVYVAMGPFDLYNDKIEVLKEILAISQKKGFKKPYQIDFTYFDYGKIYLNNMQV